MRIGMQGFPIALHKLRIEPRRRGPCVAQNEGWQELAERIQQHVKSGRTRRHCPEHQSIEKGRESSAPQQISKFGHRSWNSPEKLIATNTLKKHAVVAGLKTSDVICVLVDIGSRTRRSGEGIGVKDRVPMIPKIQSHVSTNSAALLLDFFKKGRLIPVWFRIVVVRNGVEPRSFRESSRGKGIGHANDGRRVHSSTEFREHGTLRAKSPLHGFAKHGTKVFLVFAVMAVNDFLRCVEVP